MSLFSGALSRLTSTYPFLRLKATWVRLTLLYTLSTGFLLVRGLFLAQVNKASAAHHVILEEATSRNTLEEAPDSVDDDNELLEALEEEGNSNTTLIALSLKHNYIYHK